MAAIGAGSLPHEAQGTPHPRAQGSPTASRLAGNESAAARIAVYTGRDVPPRIITVGSASDGTDGLRTFLDELSAEAHRLVREQGGRIPFDLVRELVENLVHASFAEVVVSILDGGNTFRVSDRGPGIPDKQAALRAGFTTASGAAKQVIRGVGSGLALVQEAVRAMDGVLELEDNLQSGTVVTVRVTPAEEARESSLAPTDFPSYNLSERQLKALLLTVELAPVGPTRIARELGVATSTAYRDLVVLEEAGLVVSQATGHRSVTEAGLAYLNALL